MNQININKSDKTDSLLGTGKVSYYSNSNNNNINNNNIPLPNNNHNHNKGNNSNLSPLVNNINNSNNFTFKGQKNTSSNPLSPKMNNNNGNESRDEVKVFLLKVKERIPAKDFKEFITDIKLLTDKNNVCNKKEIINHVNTIFANHRDLYERFEEILLIKKN